MSRLEDGKWTMTVDEFYDDLAVAWRSAWEMAKSYHPQLADVQVRNPYCPMKGDHVFSEYRTSNRAGFECSCGVGGSGAIDGPWGFDPWTTWHEHYLRVTREYPEPAPVPAPKRRSWWRR